MLGQWPSGSSVQIQLSWHTKAGCSSVAKGGNARRAWPTMVSGIDLIW